jgi:hypothetical protein
LRVHWERRAEALTASPADRVFDVRNGRGVNSLGEIENKLRVAKRAENFYDVTVAYIGGYVIDDRILKDCVLPTGQETAAQ